MFAHTPLDLRSGRGPDRSEVILPSRQGAFAQLRRALLETRTPVLLTGEAGSGKTWLSDRLLGELASGGNWLTIDVGPATTPIDLHLSLLGQLAGELPRTDRSARVRQHLERALIDARLDGRPWSLRVEELHLASPEILEELRLLSNRVGTPSGFARLFLIGQTSLVHRLGSRSACSLGARLHTHCHLLPLDADEALLWLSALRPEVDWSLEQVEALHRDAAGNPALLRRLCTHTVAHSTHRTDRPHTLSARPHVLEEIESGPDTTLAAHQAHSARPHPPHVGPLIPTKPPIAEEDGLIEVGWLPEPLDADTGAFTSEAIHDPYAALQALNERNAASRAQFQPTPDPGTGAVRAGDPWSNAAHEFASFGSPGETDNAEDLGDI